MIKFIKDLSDFLFGNNISWLSSGKVESDIPESLSAEGLKNSIEPTSKEEIADGVNIAIVVWENDGELKPRLAELVADDYTCSLSYQGKTGWVSQDFSEGWNIYQIKKNPKHLEKFNKYIKDLKEKQLVERSVLLGKIADIKKTMLAKKAAGEDYGKEQANLNTLVEYMKKIDRDYNKLQKAVNDKVNPKNPSFDDIM